MKLLVEKLPLADNTSFVARTHRTPHFEVGWHQHEEYELILFTEGEGMSFVGNDIGTFQKGDVFFLGSNLPHTFQKSSADLITSAVVVHFTDSFWGRDFLQIPECRQVRNLLEHSSLGLKIGEAAKEKLQPLIQSLEHQQDFQRLVTLMECLQVLSTAPDTLALSTQEIRASNARDKDRVDRVFNHAMTHFKEPVQLAEVAALAGMTVPAFCNYFKRRTRKTYIDFINEIRIGCACNLLLNTDMSVLDVCYDSGFNSVAHFNRMFLKIKEMTPTQYRRKCAAVSA